MNFNLAKRELNTAVIDTVSARDIHQEVDSKQQFDKWINKRVEQGGFIEGEDFTTFLTKSTGGRPAKEYHISVDMAKHLGMMERNEQGKRVRQYFINVDNKQIPSAPLVLTSGQIALSDATALNTLYDMMKVPKSYAIQEIAKQVSITSGIDVTKALNQSDFCSNVPDEDIYLEPKDLGELYGISGIKMNQVLAECELQFKEGGSWRPTDSGKSISIKHAWTTQWKSGYNLKWKVSVINKLMEMHEAA